MKKINGTITSPKGFLADGVACGLKANGNLDLALVESEALASVAGVFTKNIVKGHSLQLTMDNLKSKKAKAVLINSGNANACVGEKGYSDAKEITTFLSEKLDCAQENVLFCSTGVIGYRLNKDKIKSGIESFKLSKDGGANAQKAIMTTDLVQKSSVYTLDINGAEVTIAGMAKGSGMIHPNMATMIGVITTDASIEQSLLQEMLSNAIKSTFNRVSVDGDTSVCDTVLLLANGASGSTPIEANSSSYTTFYAALLQVCTDLSRAIAKDGEGATTLVNVIVKNARTQDDATKAAFAIAKSPLVKTAVYGKDANWGRILTAAGYSGAEFDPNKVDVYIGDLITCENGTALLFDEDIALKILEQDEVTLLVDFKDGEFEDHVWTCDFSHEYVTINGDYRT